MGHRAAVAWHPDGVRLATGADDHLMSLWNTEWGELLWTSLVLPNNELVTFGPGGELLAGNVERLDGQLSCIIEIQDGTRRLRPVREFLKPTDGTLESGGDQELRRCILSASSGRPR